MDDLGNRVFRCTGGRQTVPLNANDRYSLESPNGRGKTSDYPLEPQVQVRIGRKPDSDIRLSDAAVSDHHALVAPGAEGAWYVYDLNTDTGTYVNGIRIAAGTRLKPGDEIGIGAGQSKARLIFRKRGALPGGSVVRQTSGRPFPSITEVLPILSRKKPMTAEHFIHGFIVVTTVGIAFFFRDSTPLFAAIVALGMTALSCTELWNIAGRYPRFYAAFLTLVITTAFAIGLARLFDVAWPRVPGDTIAHNVERYIAKDALAQLSAAVPILLGVLIGSRAREPWRGRFGVFDPLDAIVLSLVGAAAIESVDLFKQSFPGAGLLELKRILLNSLGDIIGQMAYSGYFGYAIGLGVRYPRSRWWLLLGGWTVSTAPAVTPFLLALLLHNKDSVKQVVNSLDFAALNAVVGAFSFALLVTAILRARVTVGLSEPRAVPSGIGT